VSVLKKETSSTAWQCTDNVAWGCDMGRELWTPNHLDGGHNAFGPQYLAFEIHILASKWVIWYSSWPACRELPASPVQKLYTNSTFISRNSSILRLLTRTLTCKLPYRCIWRFFEWHSLSPSHWLLHDTGHTRSRSRLTTTTLVTVSVCPFQCCLPVCDVSVCLCPSHFLSTRLQVRPLNGFLQLIASKTRIYARMCLLVVSMMNNHI